METSYSFGLFRNAMEEALLLSKGFFFFFPEMVLRSICGEFTIVSGQDPMLLVLPPINSCVFISSFKLPTWSSRKEKGKKKSSLSIELFSSLSFYLLHDLDK